MRVEIVPATANDTATLDALFQLYAYDFSEVLDLDVGDDGRFAGAPPLDRYFAGGKDRAFLLRAGPLAGFALVGGGRLSDDPDVTDVHEFFVLRRHRRRGVGAEAARALFDRFPGRWEVRERERNTGAQAFWRAVIARYTGGAFDEIPVRSPAFTGVAQRFRSASSAPTR
jgi:predicted acetyltransferase